MVLDIATTAYIIGNGGHEANPFMVLFAGNVVSLTGIKFAMCLVIVMMATYSERVMEGGSVWVMMVASLESCLPVISNVLVIARVIQ
jgi:hypothetical protein